ncbi:MAG: formate dehydrogenase subunit gamma [Casimicrobiaceae bacterium]
MSIRTFGKAAAAFTAAFVISAGVAMAQSPAVNPQEAAAAKNEVVQQRVQPLNNAPVWKEVRSGMPQVTTVIGRETNILVQSDGQTWRAIRNGPISIYGGWLIALIVLAIGTFYFVKGTMPMHEPPTGRLLRRFTPWDRAVHWTTASVFVVLAISGLVMLFGKSLLLPIIGATLFSWLAIVGKNLHNFLGPLFIVCLILIFATFVRNNFPQRGDAAWIAHFGGLFSGRDTPSFKFNAGEKMWFWGGVAFLGFIVGSTGLILDFPNFDQTRETMQWAHVFHSVGGILFMTGALGHIYMGTIGMVGAYDAMRTGYVDEAWAREHHLYWYNDIKAGKDPSALVRPGDQLGTVHANRAPHTPGRHA